MGPLDSGAFKSNVPYVQLRPSREHLSRALSHRKALRNVEAAEGGRVSANVAQNVLEMVPGGAVEAYRHDGRVERDPHSGGHRARGLERRSREPAPGDEGMRRRL